LVLRGITLKSAARREAGESPYDDGVCRITHINKRRVTFDLVPFNAKVTPSVASHNCGAVRRLGHGEIRLFRSIVIRGAAATSHEKCKSDSKHR